MDLNKQELCERLNQSVEYLKNNGIVHTQTDIAKDLGVSRSRISEAVKGTPKRFTMGFLKKFADAYGDYINAKWLLTGEGDMERKDPHKFKPNVPLTVAAGFMGGSVESALLSGCEMHPTIPFLHEYDFTIRVVGDSMLPKLEEGDIIACRYIDDLSEIKPTKMYVIDTADGAVVKMIRLDGNNLICTSINPKYEAYSLPTSNILRVAQVVGAVTDMD